VLLSGNDLYGVLVGVAAGASAGVGLGLGVAIGVAVGRGVGIGVGVAVGWGVGAAATVDVAAGVAVGAGVGEDVGTGVGVTVGVAVEAGDGDAWTPFRAGVELSVGATVGVGVVAGTKPPGWAAVGATDGFWLGMAVASRARCVTTGLDATAWPIRPTEGSGRSRTPSPMVPRSPGAIGRKAVAVSR